MITSFSILFFLQFFIWGSWYSSVSLYMSQQGLQGNIYWVFTAGPLGAIIAPFFSGFVADRLMNTEKVLSILFLCSGAAMLTLPQVAGGGDAGPVNVCIFLHMLFFMPSLGLTASLCFSHLQDTEKQFPIVRVWGTFGWIIAGLAISVLDAETDILQFYMAGGASILLALYCLFLPKTPAPKKGTPINVKDMLFWDAWSQLKNPTFAVFIACSFLICIPLAAYYAYLQQQMQAMDINNVAAMQTVGQGSEVIFMFLMPLFFKRLGVKNMIAIGIGAWALRYAIFALGASENQALLVIVGIFLHGICYDFFFVTGQVFVDQATPKEISAQVQSLNVFWTQGAGMYIGAIVSGTLFNTKFDGIHAASPDSLESWSSFWWVLCGLSAVLFVVFCFSFKYKEKPDQAVAL